MGEPQLTPDRLLPRIAALPGTGTLLVGFSGGPDSHALLHLLAALRDRLGRPLAAAHVDHRLRPESAAWAAHCAAVCSGLRLPLHRLVVDATAARGESPEAAARAARYEALGARVRAGDVLLTAHHADDQAETVLLQLLRGAGPRGLAGMPALRDLGAGAHARPLLDFPRAALADYAGRAGLESVLDPANADPDVDRSHLRWAVMPLIRARWPGIAKTLGRVARHQSRLAALEDAVARADLEAVRSGAAPQRLDTTGLGRLPRERRGAVVRAWLGERGLAAPSEAQLERVLEDLVAAAPDRSPRVAWPGVELRRHRGEIWALAAAPVPDPGPVPGRRLAWRPPAPLELPSGRLVAEPARGRGLSVERCAARDLEVVFRSGGERCRPGPGGRTRTVKNLLREWGVPPWERGLVPLVVAGDEVVAVADRCVCAGWEARGDEAGWLLRWERPGG